MRLNNLRKDQPKDEVIHDDHYENNKQQHQHIYASMDGPKLEASTRSEQGSKIHGNLLFEVGVVIALAIFFRRFWVLHGISLLLISRMLRLCVAWTTYFSDSGILTEIISLGKQLSRTVFKETEKIFQGDSFRLWVMGSSFQMASKLDAGPIFRILREQYSRINKSVMKEMQDMIAKTGELQKQRSERGQSPKGTHNSNQKSKEN